MARADPAAQLAHFDTEDDAHYAWQVGDGPVGRGERELLARARLPAGRVLEIGCGAGNNLVNAGADAGSVGIDFAGAKLRHGQARLPGYAFVRGDAQRLPFRDAAFDGVLVRDVLHHVVDRAQVVAEAARVVRPGGIVAVIEPNRWSPLILAQATLVPEERGALVSTAGRLLAELGQAGLLDVLCEHAQPLPIARAITHPHAPVLGRLRLGERPRAAAVISAVERALGRVVPRGAWMYLVARGVAPARS